MRLVPTIAVLLTACAATGPGSAPPCPIRGATPADHLIRPGEKHFAHLWQITHGGENAEGYWSFDGTRLCFQWRASPDECDSIWVTEPGGGVRQVSSGKGVTTCAFFMPGDRQLLFASTQAQQEDCPPAPDHSLGYVWPIRPEYDIWLHDLDTGAERVLIGGPGYDAEATISPSGERIVFTSTRSGDLELWTCDLDGGNLRQVTDAIGYDGGGFFSHDGEWIVFRTTAFTPGKEVEEQARYKELLALSTIRPHSMEIYVVRADGSERRQVTHLGQANWAPYFFPDDSRIIFSSNHTWSGQGPINFDLWAIDTNGENLERITYEDQFDSFPMFSPDGRYLAFASNRGGSRPGETNLFIAEWR